MTSPEFWNLTLLLCNKSSNLQRIKSNQRFLLGNSLSPSHYSLPLMKTDTIFYRIFKELPSTLFDLLGESPTPNNP